MNFRELLTQRLQAFFPGLDPEDPRFRREVLDPLIQYLGDDIPRTDARSLILARLDEQFPSMDNSAFADLFGKPSTALVDLLLREISAIRQRRRTDAPAALTQEDLRDQFSSFLVDPRQGRFSRGVARIYYSIPRSVAFDETQQISVRSADGQVLVFRPEAPVAVTLQQMRSSREDSLYYADLPLIAAEPGERYDLAPGEIRGATGIPGALRIDNPRRFTGGQSADTAATLRARIQFALRRRGLATVGGLSSTLPAVGIEEYRLVRGGDPLMVRDRIYGPVTIAGVPGGFRSFSPPALVPNPGGGSPILVDSQSIPPGNFVSLGIAFDIWSAPGEKGLVALTLSNLYDEGGMEAMIADGIDVVSYNDLTGDTHVQLQLRSVLETISSPDIVRPEIGPVLPLMETSEYFFHISRIFDTSTSRRRRFDVTNVLSGSGLQATAQTPFPTPSEFGRTLRLMKRVWAYTPGDHTSPQSQTLDLDDARQPYFFVPLTWQRALDLDGEEVMAGSSPAHAVPGTARAEIVDGVPIGKPYNLVDDADLLPLVNVERVQTLEPDSGDPAPTFVYPRHPLYAEFLESLPGTAAEKAVKLRVHLLGPQAFGLGDCLVTAEGSTQFKYTPLFWEYPSVTTGSNGPQTRRISSGFTNQVLSVSQGQTTTTVPNRPVRVGDIAQFITPSGDQYVLPITSVSSGELELAAEDLPPSTTGHLFIYQGASRRTLREEGRGPEGTYSVDIWLREAVGEPGYVPGNAPLYGTKAVFPATGIVGQGFDIFSPLPGQEFSLQEQPTLVFQGQYFADGEVISSRSVILHGRSAPAVRRLQALLDVSSQDEASPMVTSGLAKSFAPAYVVAAFYYDAEDLSPESAADVLAEEIEKSVVDRRIELSDMKAALYDAGADFVVSGRLFVLRQNHLRQWEYFATRGSVSSLDIGEFRLSALTCVKLRRRARGESVDELDLSTWESDPFTLRGGGFDVD